MLPLALFRIALLAGVALICPVWSQVKVPALGPQIQGAFPHGGQRGSVVSITLRGRNLQDTGSILFRSAKLRAEVLSSTPYQVKARVFIAADAEPGRHDLRLQASHGTALGYFDVGTRAERNEKEPNSDRGSAESLDFPATVNGVITAGDYDYFRFRAKAGQTLLFNVLATRNGSPLDSVLSLLDETGEEIAYSDDYYGFKDPHLVHRFEREGEYFLRVYGSGESGSDSSDYRLIAGMMPHADLALPSGARRGATVEVALRGVNLDALDEVTLGDGMAKGKVLSRGPMEALVRLRVPDDMEAGEHRLHLGSGALPVPFVVGRFPEVTAKGEIARRKEDPLPVELPVVVNGIIGRRKAADYFTFRVDAPQSVTLDVESMRLGFLLDPLVIVYDETGQNIAWQDDPTTNTGKEPANMDPHLVVRLPKAGRYTATIRDAAFRGDPAYAYRMTLKKSEPDFSLRTIGPDEVLYRGRKNIVLVRVRRLEGWDTPVEVAAENLPPGVRAKPVVAEPKNTPYTGTCGETHYLDGTNVEMVFEVASDAPLQTGQIRFRGRGVLDGRVVERTARARYFKQRVRLIGDSEEHDLRATVAEAPGAVLTVPATAALGRDGSAGFTVIVTRLDERSEPLEITAESAAGGWEMEPVTVPAGVTRASVRLRAGAQAPAEFRLAGRAGGVIIGRSHPVRVSKGGSRKMEESDEN